MDPIPPAEEQPEGDESNPRGRTRFVFDGGTTLDGLMPVARVLGAGLYHVPWGRPSGYVYGVTLNLVSNEGGVVRLPAGHLDGGWRLARQTDGTVAPYIGGGACASVILVLPYPGVWANGGITAVVTESVAVDLAVQFRVLPNIWSFVDARGFTFGTVQLGIDF